MDTSRCGGCHMPSTSGSLWVVGRRLRCGSCLRAEVADLKKRVRLAREIALDVNDFAPSAGAKLLPLLDLRKPLPGKRGV